MPAGGRGLLPFSQDRRVCCCCSAAVPVGHRAPAAYEVGRPGQAQAQAQALSRRADRQAEGGVKGGGRREDAGRGGGAGQAGRDRCLAWWAQDRQGVAAYHRGRGGDIQLTTPFCIVCISTRPVAPVGKRERPLPFPALAWPALAPGHCYTTSLYHKAIAPIRQAASAARSTHTRMHGDIHTHLHTHTLTHTQTTLPGQTHLQTHTHHPRARLRRRWHIIIVIIATSLDCLSGALLCSCTTATGGGGSRNEARVTHLHTRTRHR